MITKKMKEKIGDLIWLTLTVGGPVLLVKLVFMAASN